MNCQKFSHLVSDLTRGQLMDAALREAAMSHAAVCRACSLRLSDEKALSAGLQAVAAMSELREAPVHLESELLAAFRQQQAAMVTPEIARMPGKIIQHLSAPRWWMLTAAAAILLLLAWSASVFNSGANMTPEQSAQNPPPVPIVRDNENAPLPVKSEAPPKAQPELLSQAPRRVDSRIRSAYGIESARAGRVRRPVRISRQNPDDQVEEIYTDFIPLTQDLSPVENGHLMRVNVPRTVLPKFGLPMNPARFNEAVPAEVLMSDDGRARAIRFANVVPVKMNRY